MVSNQKEYIFLKLFLTYHNLIALRNWAKIEDFALRMSQLHQTNCCSDPRPISGAANEKGGEAKTQRKQARPLKSNKKFQMAMNCSGAIINLWRQTKCWQFCSFFYHQATILATGKLFWSPGNFFGCGEALFLDELLIHQDLSSIKRSEKIVF